MFQERRQQKITAAFEKQNNHDEGPSDGGDDLEEMIEDNRMLREKLQEMEAYLFHLQKKKLPQPRQFQPRNMAAISDEISSIGGEVVLQNKRAKLRERQDLYLRHFGIQVKHLSDDLCVVVYNVSLGDMSAEYALQFARVPGLDNWELKKYHLPLGFCMEPLSELDPMTVTYMRRLQTALVAYHQRQAQLVKFKESKPAHVYIYHSVNGTNVEITFPMASRDTRNCENIDVMLELKYDPLESRPQFVNITQNVCTDNSMETMLLLMKQFFQLKSHRLWDAFSAAVSRNSSHPYFCPEEEDAYEMHIQRNQVETDKNRRQPSRSHQQEEISNEEYVPPLRHPQKQNQQKQFDELSDSSSDSFSALSQQLLHKKKTASVKTKTVKGFKKPATPKVASPESLHYIEDDNDEYVTEVLKERNSKKSKEKTTKPAVSKMTQKKRSYQSSEQLSDVTADSYVYIPETKSKRVSKKTDKAQQLSLTAQTKIRRMTVGRENNSLVKAPAKQGRSKK